MPTGYPTARHVPNDQPAQRPRTGKLSLSRLIWAGSAVTALGLLSLAGMIAWRAQGPDTPISDVAVAAVSAAMVVFLGALAAREVRRRDRAESELRRQTALLRATLENMDQGLMMFDADGAIRVVNERTAELLGLPLDLLKRRPHLREVLDYQIARGEFAGSDESVRRLVDSGGFLDQRHSYERVRPNGRAIEVRVSAIPLRVDGGDSRGAIGLMEARGG